MDLEQNYPRDDIRLYSNVEQLPVPYSQNSGSEEFSSKSLLNSPNTRLQFVRKVFSILLMQLSVTALISYHSMTNIDIASFQADNPAPLVISAVATITIMILIFCNKSLARTVPTNYILLTVFTLAESYIVSFMCSMFCWDYNHMPIEEGRHMVYLAALMTISVTIALMIYAFTTKEDITLQGSMLFIFVSIGTMSMFSLFFFNQYLFQLGIASMSAVIYAFYIIYDTQLIMGGKAIEFTVDDYILGAMMLYLDIIRLFIRILQIMQKRK